MKILSSFTDPHVVPNLYELIFSVEHKRSNFDNIHTTAHSYHVKKAHKSNRKLVTTN